MNILSALLLNFNEIRNAVLQNLASTPSGAKPGSIWYGTSGNAGYVWNGTVARPMDAALLTDGSIQNAALQTNPLQRINHSGTQPSSTISDLATTVKGYTLDAFASPIAAVNWGAQRLTALANASTATDAVPLAQVNSLIAAAVAGQTAIKVPARAYAAGNVTLSGLQTIDGVSLAAGDRVLAPNQSTASQNGLYVAATGGWALAIDGNLASEWTEGTEILIAEGTAYGGAIFRQATANPTLTTLTFVQTAKTNTYSADNTTLTMSGTVFSVSYGAGLTVSGGKLTIDTSVVVRKFVGTITGDGTTTSFPFTHGLGTAACHVTIRDSSGNQVLVDNVVTGTTATAAFGSAPASGMTYTIVVTG